MFDYLVVGAGYAGAVIAERIAFQSKQKVLVVEQRHHLGGNCYDEKDENGIIVHKYGPHLFHTNNKEVFDYLSQFTDWQIYHHKVLAYIDGLKVPIPFNLNTVYKLFPATLAKIIEEKLLKEYDYGSRIPILELQKTKDNDLHFLASFIYEKVFVNYTSKQWGKRPEEIDAEVTARVPIVIGKDDRYFNDQYQVIPKQGYTRLFKNMLTHPNIKLMLGTGFGEICKIKDGQFYLFGHKFEGKIIYTGKIDELFNYKFGDLPYRSIDMHFETMEREDYQYYQETTTVNYPNDYDFTRITEFKHIHPTNSNKTTILKEYPQQHERDRNIPYYPIFTDENQIKYAEYVDNARKFKQLFLLGRLAEYKYYDMDDIVKRALELYEKELKNAK